MATKSIFLDQLRILLGENFYMGHLVKYGESNEGGISDEMFIIPPTCNEPGREYFMCGKCGNIHDIELPATKHDWTDNIIAYAKLSYFYEADRFFIRDDAQKEYEETGKHGSIPDDAPYYRWYGCAGPNSSSYCTYAWNIRLEGYDNIPYDIHVCNLMDNISYDDDIDAWFNDTKIITYRNDFYLNRSHKTIRVTLKSGNNLIKVTLNNNSSNSNNSLTWTYYIDLPPVKYGKICRICNDEHICSYENIIQEPTCILGGLSTNVCPICGMEDNTIENIQPALGHHLVLNGTCTECGYPQSNVTLDTLTPGLYDDSLTMTATWDELIAKGIIKLQDKTAIKRVNKGISGKLVIDRSITKILNSSFTECKLLDFLYIPESVVKIGEGCWEPTKTDTAPFFGCDNLAVFYNTAQDAKYTKPEFWNTVSIPDNYSDNTPLNTLKIYGEFIKIEDGCKVVYRNDDLSSPESCVYVIPNSVISFNSTFEIPEGVTYFKLKSLEDMFGCENVTALHLSSTVTSVVRENPYPNSYTIDQFEEKYPRMYKLESITVSELNNTYSSVDGVLCTKNKVWFYPYSKKDEEFSLADNPEITKTSKCSFANNRYLKRINFGNAELYSSDSDKIVEQMPELESFEYSGIRIGGAFRLCPKLKVIPAESLKNVASIYDDTFYSCGVTEIEFPETVSYIDTFAVCQCTQLRKVWIPINSSKKITLCARAFGLCKELESGKTYTDDTVLSAPPKLFLEGTETDDYTCKTNWQYCSTSTGTKVKYPVKFSALKSTYDAY